MINLDQHPSPVPYINNTQTLQQTHQIGVVDVDSLRALGRLPSLAGVYLDACGLPDARRLPLAVAAALPGVGGGGAGSSPTSSSGGGGNGGGVGSGGQAATASVAALTGLYCVDQLLPTCALLLLFVFGGGL